MATTTASNSVSTTARWQPHARHVLEAVIARYDAEPLLRRLQWLQWLQWRANQQPVGDGE